MHIAATLLHAASLLALGSPAASPANAPSLEELPATLEGPHLCGDQWNGYNEVCTFSLEGGVLTLTSEGPSTVVKGTVTMRSPDVLELQGEVAVRALPLGMDSLTRCHEAGPYVFRRTGKRNYFRYVRTCSDQTTYYFDIFVPKLSAAALKKRTKKLSELKGRTQLLWPANLDAARCESVNAATLQARAGGEKKAAAIPCQRHNQHGYSSRGYYSCDVEHALESESVSDRVDVRLLVFDRPKDCQELFETLGPK